MPDKDEAPCQDTREAEQVAAQRARNRATVARWDLNVTVFLFAVLIIVIILLFQGVRTEIVAPIALFGLAMVWIVGWRKGRQLYRDFYGEEISKLGPRQEKTVEKTVEETIEEKIQKALRERGR